MLYYITQNVSLHWTRTWATAVYVKFWVKCYLKRLSSTAGKRKQKLTSQQD